MEECCLIPILCFVVVRKSPRIILSDFLDVSFYRFLLEFFVKFYFGFSLVLQSIEWWSCWRISNISSSQRLLWQIVMRAFVWVIWRERNERMFNNSTKMCSFLLNSIIDFSVFWSNILSLPLKRTSECVSVRVREFLHSAMRISSSVQLVSTFDTFLDGNAQDIAVAPPRSVLRTYFRRRRHGIMLDVTSVLAVS